MDRCQLEVSIQIQETLSSLDASSVTRVCVQLTYMFPCSPAQLLKTLACLALSETFFFYKLNKIEPGNYRNYQKLPYRNGFLWTAIMSLQELISEAKPLPCHVTHLRGAYMAQVRHLI